MRYGLLIDDLNDSMDFAKEEGKLREKVLLFRL